MNLISIISTKLSANCQDYIYASILAIIIWKTTEYIFLDDKYQNKNNSKLKKYLNDLLWSCTYETDNKVLQNIGDMTKGKKYFFIRGEEYNDIYRKKCFLTTYHVAHFLMYVIYGFLFPAIFYEIFVVSTLFEIFEYYYCNCEDIMDVLYNFIGLVVGYNLRMSYIK